MAEKTYEDVAKGLCLSEAQTIISSFSRGKYSRVSNLCHCVLSGIENHTILSIVDLFTKRYWAFEINSKDSIYVSSSLNAWIETVGFPGLVLSDKGSEFLQYAISFLRGMSIAITRTS